MIFICEHCHYMFEADLKECRCQDCGKLRIRPALGAEKIEYWKLQEGKRSLVSTFLAPKKSEIITLKKLRFFKGAKSHG